jgi:hypothetical protein
MKRIEYMPEDDNLLDGELILFSWGEYTDYGPLGLYEVLTPFNLTEKKIEFTNNTQNTFDYPDNCSKFEQFLIDEGYVVLVKIKEFNLLTKD